MKILFENVQRRFRFQYWCFNQYFKTSINCYLILLTCFPLMSKLNILYALFLIQNEHNTENYLIQFICTVRLFDNRDERRYGRNIRSFRSKFWWWNFYKLAIIIVYKHNFYHQKVLQVLNLIFLFSSHIFTDKFRNIFGFFNKRPLKRNTKHFLSCSLTDNDPCLLLTFLFTISISTIISMNTNF